jgi:hypothetical protein
MPSKTKPITSTLTLETLIDQGSQAAFDSVRKEIVAVPITALATINLDVSRAARRGLVVAERVRPLLPELSTMSHLDFKKLEKLATYALALLWAHNQAEEPDEATPPLAEVLAEAVPLRENLLLTAETLAHFGLVSRERVAFIRSGQGHADTAADLLALGRLLRETWEDIEHKVAVTREEVDRAIPLGTRLQQAIGVRESEKDPLIEPTDPRHVRAQAFTLFMSAYDECYYGVRHLRRQQGDADRIVPSLYPRRPSRKHAEADAADDLFDPGSVIEPEVGPAPQPEPVPIAETAA